MCLAVTTRKLWSYLALFSLIHSMHFYLQISNCYLISKTMSLFETLNIYQSSSSIGPSSPRGSTGTTSIFPNMNELVAVWKKLVKNGSVSVVNLSQTIYFDTHYIDHGRLYRWTENSFPFFLYLKPVEISNKCFNIIWTSLKVV